MPRSLHPDHGARLRLTRLEADEAGARYALAIYDPAEVYTSEVGLALEEGEARIGAFEAEPPEWTVRWAELFLKAFVKARGRERERPGGPRWPRTITRWREERAR